MNDSDARELIVKDTDTNFFVEAGAGSGKTTMLVERMTAMVEKGLPVEKICTITFTKAAANEFYERFQKKLVERSRVPDQYVERKGRLPKPTAETAERCRKALQNIDLCFMGTIDSFCNMILSEHPTEAKIPDDATLIDDDTASQIYRQSYLSARSGEYGEDLKELSAVFSRLYYNPEDAYADMMKEIMDRRNIHFQSVKVSDQRRIEDVFRKERNDLITVLNEFSKDISKMVLPMKKDDDRDPADVFRGYKATISRGWNYNYTGVMSAIKNMAGIEYDASFAELGITNECVAREQAGKTVLNVMDKDNPDSLYYRMMNFKYQISLEFVLGCSKYLADEMKQNGQFTYFDYLYYLREMLKTDAQESGNLIGYIHDRHSVFMIDEFQDTNPMQAEVFFYLSSEKPVTDWKQCKPRPGSLFIVGDPKQSIYRFRAADISSYLRIKKLFEDGVGKVLYLTNNFRSRSVMKNYFNDVFIEKMPVESEDQSAYRDIENTDPDRIDGFEGVYTYQSFSDKSAESDDQMLVKIVETMAYNEKVKIVEKDASGEEYLRTLKYDDFMIIYAGKKRIGSCITAFKNHGIPLRAEGKVVFEECEGLKTIISIYKAITDKNDAISLVSALFTPVFGLNENDLTAYKKAGGSISLESKPECSDLPAGNAMKRLRETVELVPNQTPSSLFEKIMDDYEIFRYVSSDNLEIVYYTLELLRNEERTGKIVTFEDASRYLDTLVSGKSDLERCLNLKQNEDAVRIANLHKVKGLEAPVVILARSGANNNPQADIRIEYHDDSADGYLIMARQSSSDSNYKYALVETNRFDQQKGREKESLKKEYDRMVYVAATRARNVLIVNQPMLTDKKSGKPKRGSSNKWKDLMAQAGGDIFEAVPEIDRVKIKNEDQGDNKPVAAEELYSESKPLEARSSSTYSLKSPSTMVSSSNYEEIPEEKEGVNEYKNSGSDETYATLIGTMVHRLMEMIIMSKDKLGKDDIVNNVLSEYMIAEMEGCRGSFRQKLESVFEVMHHGGYPQVNDAVQDILPMVLNADEVYSEVPFTYKEGDEIWNGIIDLIYREDGRLHIIDWKTNKSDDGLAEHYKEQLDAYKKAVKQIIGEEAEDAMIYHISIS
ncbi:MAG: UvrD-helicase domain-containing protein [Erysipelotrichaceae bacterium]|nr:UvrD-helicase domain-containing protein [Erysipelotrichaceae bacterium]